MASHSNHRSIAARYDGEHERWCAHLYLPPSPILCHQQQPFPSYIGIGSTYACQYPIDPTLFAVGSGPHGWNPDGWNFDCHYSPNLPVEAPPGPSTPFDVKNIVAITTPPSLSARRQLACPFYLHAPDMHSKCASKKFAFLSRVRSVIFLLPSYFQSASESLRVIIACREHIATHTYPYRCDNCNNYFGRQFVLKRHSHACGGQKSKGRQLGLPSLHEAMVKKGRIEDMVEVLEEMDGMM